MARKFVISPTKLSVYYLCPAKYKLEYIDRLGRFYHRARAGYAFGHSLHRALDVFHNTGGAAEVSAADLDVALDQAWVSAGYGDTEEEQAFRVEARRILEEYHAAETRAEEIVEAPPQTLWTEKTIRIDLTPDVALTGRIDRVDEHADGSLEIVDYKSGRLGVSEEDVRSSLALSIYQILVHRRMPDRRVFATIVALRSGARASAELSAQEREELSAALTETGEEIRTRDWEYVFPVINSHCPDCDFLPYCTRYWRKSGVPASDIPRREE